MQRIVPGIVAFAALAALVVAEEPPSWAFAVNPPATSPAPVDEGVIQHVPDSMIGLTRTRIAAIGGEVPDWHPEEHPAMPAIVAKGRAPAIYACGYCHLPTGAGRPENASLAGLSAGYIKAQMLAFKNGTRPGSEPKRVPQTVMIAIAQAATDPEIDAAAAYFASVKPQSFVTVVESTTAPKSIIAGWMEARAPGGGDEPIGNRIVEIADDFERFEKRDSRTPFTAYVPVGSIQRGADLVAGGGGKTLLCAACHGPDLKGLADVPRLVGRSPSFLMRQLYDIRAGNRRGGTVELMKPVVMNLTTDDMMAISAYLASRAP